jgi:hypothetical protein
MANRTTGLGLYKGFQFAYTTTGGPPQVEHVPLVSGTYYPGDVLRCSATTGSAAKIAAAGTSAAYVNSVYVSTADSTTGKYPVYPTTDNNIFKAKMVAASECQKKVGDLCDIATSAPMSLQATASTNVISIVGFPGGTPIASTANNYYYVKFAQSVWAQTKSDVTK